jgi:hypothetical protein
MEGVQEYTPSICRNNWRPLSQDIAVIAACSKSKLVDAEQSLKAPPQARILIRLSSLSSYLALVMADFMFKRLPQCYWLVSGQAPWLARRKLLCVPFNENCS